MRHRVKLSIYIILATIPSVTVFAQGESPSPVSISGLCPTDDISACIQSIYNFSVYIGGFLAMAAIVWGAIEWTTSAGNPSKLSEAKDRITSAVYGMILLLAAYLILNTINPQLTELKPLGALPTNDNPNGQSANNNTPPGEGAFGGGQGGQFGGYGSSSEW
ncbi:MAG: pilin [bacterium]|nr:pilin [bacterium]